MMAVVGGDAIAWQSLVLDSHDNKSNNKQNKKIKMVMSTIY
jgi:hypothetical protein